MFNRGGFTRGYGPGVAEAELMYPERPNHIGVAVGDCRRDGEVTLTADVETADALVAAPRGEDIPVKLAGEAGERVRCFQARRGDGLWRLVSEAQMQSARASFNGEHRQTPVTAKATLRVGAPAWLSVSDGSPHRVEAVGDAIETPRAGALRRGARRGAAEKDRRHGLSRRTHRLQRGRERLLSGLAAERPAAGRAGGAGRGPHERTSGKQAV